MAEKVKFVQNELGNMIVLNEDNNDLEGFIKHIELFKNTPEIIHLNITEEEFNDCNNIYAYIRHNRKTKIDSLIKQIETAFSEKHLYYETKIHKDKLVIIDLFFYK